MSGSGQIRQKAEAGDWGHAALNLWDNDYEALRQIVRAMKPGEVEHAGAAYDELAARMKSSMDLIRKQAGALAEAWSGDPADQALRKMQDLHNAAFQIQSKSTDTGAALKDHAATQRKWQSTIKEEHWYGAEVGTGGTGVGDWLKGESHMGRELMQQMQQDTVESNDRFPAELRADVIRVGLDEFKPIEDGNEKGLGGVDPGSSGPGAGTSGHLPGSHPSTSTGGSDSFGDGGHLIGGTTSGGGTGAGHQVARALDRLMSRSRARSSVAIPALQGSTQGLADQAWELSVELAGAVGRSASVRVLEAAPSAGRAGAEPWAASAPVGLAQVRPQVVRPVRVRVVVACCRWHRRPASRTRRNGSVRPGSPRTRMSGIRKTARHHL